MRCERTGCASENLPAVCCYVVQAVDPLKETSVKWEGAAGLSAAAVCRRGGTRRKSHNLLVGGVTAFRNIIMTGSPPGPPFGICRIRTQINPPPPTVMALLAIYRMGNTNASPSKAGRETEHDRLHCNMTRACTGSAEPSRRTGNHRPFGTRCSSGPAREGKEEGKRGLPSRAPSSAQGPPVRFCR
ncbi:hypothetical protein BCV70DRAFT_107177 [Testicularia cyperi]|uniref:Uncharacterized protein n=1 Tax=Testicularia cyperi TaxID=1882483 RepID=A0A317XR08_9BASI|nr:hypothetical protein BCV70DRAFT_107177 [Testicularia cyperi]